MVFAISLKQQQNLQHFPFYLFPQSVLREGYLKEMIGVLSDPRYGSNLSQVDATVKKHEAISADIMARVSSLVSSQLQTRVTIMSTLSAA